MMKNIVLCGFMGCGKSTVGKTLAANTHRTFVDMDHYIEEQAGRTVSAIFAEDGEATFRAMETDACRTLGMQNGLVIATGGGAVLNPENVDALKENGTVVWLNVSADCVLHRLSGDTTRPLLLRPDKDAAVRELMAAREPFYRAAADITVEADFEADTVAKSVEAALVTEIG